MVVIIALSEYRKLKNDNRNNSPRIKIFIYGMTKKLRDFIVIGEWGHENINNLSLPNLTPFSEDKTMIL